MIEKLTELEQQSQKDEMALRLAEYLSFLESLFAKRRELEKFTKGMKGMRETAVKQDRVIIADMERVFDERAKASEEKTLSTPLEARDLILSLKDLIGECVAGGLKSRREIDKYFDQACENLASAVFTMDKIIIDKIVELLQNIENSQSAEVDRLKVQIADLVAEKDELARENTALRAGLPKKPKEVPELPSPITREVKCPICLQVWPVPAGTSEYKCQVCSHQIMVD